MSFAFLWIFLVVTKCKSAVLWIFIPICAWLYSIHQHTHMSMKKSSSSALNLVGIFVRFDLWKQLINEAQCSPSYQQHTSSIKLSITRSFKSMTIWGTLQKNSSLNFKGRCGVFKMLSLFMCVIRENEEAEQLDRNSHTEGEWESEEAWWTFLQCRHLMLPFDSLC